MPEYITVKPAYGKELNSEKEVLQHYLDGKDFMILSLHHGAGSYLNILDCERASKPISLEVRFGKKSQKVTLLDTSDAAVLRGSLKGNNPRERKRRNEMTTPAAERLYQAQHEVAMEGKGYAVFNPLNKPKADLPVIYGFNNGGRPGWMHAQLLAEDGTPLGSHLCSAECYMRHDLGILEGTRPDRHEKDFQHHYPEGYRMEFVSGEEFDSHVGLKKAIWEHNYNAEKALEKEKENE